eukprot:CAMPEP_0194160444 /NCGR_PEP_ID=MMETSP0152-20130528/78396_1 /TAXON_ID=1049557 /ORGANISM="Thalassiothrix antarctica, Strain L6-D1" /LENGTH=191 /DNA_ID=CAMNT_0038870135 /DNA_START=1395 /DNA_END=1971 /DNA_ORIENTATION=-
MHEDLQSDEVDAYKNNLVEEIVWELSDKEHCSTNENSVVFKSYDSENFPRIASAEENICENCDKIFQDIERQRRKSLPGDEIIDKVVSNLSLSQDDIVDIKDEISLKAPNKRGRREFRIKLDSEQNSCDRDFYESTQKIERKRRSLIGEELEEAIWQLFEDIDIDDCDSSSDVEENQENNEITAMSESWKE